MFTYLLSIHSKMLSNNGSAATVELALVSAAGDTFCSSISIFSNIIGMVGNTFKISSDMDTNNSNNNKSELNDSFTSIDDNNSNSPIAMVVVVNINGTLSGNASAVLEFLTTPFWQQQETIHNLTNNLGIITTQNQNYCQQQQS